MELQHLDLLHLLVCLKAFHSSQSLCQSDGHPTSVSPVAGVRTWSLVLYELCIQKITRPTSRTCGIMVITTAFQAVYPCSIHGTFISCYPDFLKVVSRCPAASFCWARNFPFTSPRCKQVMLLSTALHILRNNAFLGAIRASKIACMLTLMLLLRKQRRTRKSRYSMICLRSATECSGNSFKTASRAFTQGARRDVSCPTGSLQAIKPHDSSADELAKACLFLQYLALL